MVLSKLEEEIRVAAHHYGFLVTIEVTNGLDNKVGTKTRQALSSAGYLAYITELEPEVGLCYRKCKETIPTDSGLDFVICVGQFDESLLGLALEKILATPSLFDMETENRASIMLLLERIHNLSQREEISLCQMVTKNKGNISKYCGRVYLSRQKYRELMIPILGVAAEVHTVLLLQEMIGQELYFQRVRYGYSPMRGYVNAEGLATQDANVRTNDADVVVACEPSRFYSGLLTPDPRWDVILLREPTIALPEQPYH
ncbi:MAG: hypothetical protein ABIG95_00385 [Candidatus Woesearchaeota archaeon]